MRKRCRRSVVFLCGTVCLAVLSGCTGSMQMPINERSYVSVEAAPFGSEFRVSYHLFEVLPSDTFDDKWKTKVDFDLVGTVYDSEKSGSRGAKNIERGWETLWEDEHIGWGSVERLLTDETLADSSSSPKKAEKRAEEARQRRTPNLPIAEMPPVFMFASPVSW